MKHSSHTSARGLGHLGRARALRSFGALLFLLMFAGCVSNRAIPEFKLYLSTYDEASQTVNAVLDEFEGVELERARDHAKRFGMTPLRWKGVETEDRKQARAAGLKRIEGNGGFDDAFHIKDSVYHATNATPPITAAFRRAWAAVGAYNRVLDAYAEGRGLDEIKGELGGLASAIGSLGEAAKTGSDILGMAVPGGSLVSSGLQVVNAALEAGNKEAFRNALIDLQPEMDATLDEMREAAPALFDLLTAKRRNEVKDAVDQGVKDQGIEAIEKYRTVMSNWVVAINATELALDRVVAAIQAPDTAFSLLSDLTATTTNAAAVTAQTRRLLGEIRTGS